MLSVNSYSRSYVNECRDRMSSQLASYQALVKSATKAAGTAVSTVSAAKDRFEPLFFGHLVVVLDGYFMHRSRGLEKKDGNPLNEVRMIAASLLQHGGVLSADKTIKYVPAQSVLKIEIGSKIEILEADFIRLSKAYFAEIEAKFV